MSRNDLPWLRPALLSTLLISACPSWAAVISSAPFSLGYGYVGPWNTSETAGANTPTIIGDFTFTPTVTGTGSSGSGPQFPARVLIDGVPALTSGSAEANDFAVGVAASYTGTLPGNAQDIMLRINIDSIRARVVHRSVFGNPNPGVAWLETTPGHLGSSPVTGSIPSASGSGPELSEAARYALVAWDAADYATAGLISARSFTLDTAIGVQYAMDGFEILGTVDVLYAAVPEPGTYVLIALGSAGLAWSARRRRRIA